MTLSNTNRFGGFKGLRERWLSHLKSTLLRPVLFIDEAQQTYPEVLSELRLLASMEFHSQVLLSVILAGDQRLNDKLGVISYCPWEAESGCVIKQNMPAPEQILDVLQHLLEMAGNPGLMTPELMQTLCEHAVVIIVSFVLWLQSF